MGRWRKGRRKIGGEKKKGRGGRGEFVKKFANGGRGRNVWKEARGLSRGKIKGIARKRMILEESEI